MAGSHIWHAAQATGHRYAAIICPICNTCKDNKAATTADTLVQYDIVRCLASTNDRIHRAFLRADRAARAFLGVDAVGDQFAAGLRRAAAFVNVRLIFVAEPTERAEHGIRSGLSQSAEAGVANVLREAFQMDDALESLERVVPLLVHPAPRDAIQDFE